MSVPRPGEEAALALGGANTDGSKPSAGVMWHILQAWTFLLEREKNSREPGMSPVPWQHHEFPWGAAGPCPAFTGSLPS